MDLILVAQTEEMGGRLEVNFVMMGIPIIMMGEVVCEMRR